jgi:serine/threonine protein kinase
VQNDLERLRVETNKWAQLDVVDTIVHADMMFGTIDSFNRDLQEYDDLCRRKIYPKIIPPGDLPYLPSMMRNIENDVALRTKATNLRGQSAILFMDLLMEVCSMLKTQVLDPDSPMFSKVLDKHPDAVGRGNLLKLLQRVVEASDQLPSRLLITGVTAMIYNNQGGEATIFKCRHGDRDVAARVIQVKSSNDDTDMTRSVGECLLPSCVFLTSWELQLQGIRREIIVHRQLKNRNILELLGIIKTDQHPLTIITPWMENGQASKYLKTHPENFMTVVRRFPVRSHYKSHGS